MVDWNRPAAVYMMSYRIYWACNETDDVMKQCS